LGLWIGRGKGIRNYVNVPPPLGQPQRTPRAPRFTKKKVQRQAQRRAEGDGAGVVALVAGRISSEGWKRGWVEASRQKAHLWT